MIESVVLPVVVLAALAWVVPWGLSKVLPEGVFWLGLIAVLAAALLTGVSAIGFYVLYGASGAVVLEAAPWHFVVLSARAALVWGPVMVLSLADVPRGWKEAVW